MPRRAADGAFSRPHVHVHVSTRPLHLALPPPPAPQADRPAPTPPQNSRRTMSLSGDGQQDNRPMAVTQGMVSRDRGDSARRAPARTIVDPRTGQAPTISRPHHAPIAVRHNAPSPQPLSQPAPPKTYTPVPACDDAARFTSGWCSRGSFAVVNNSLKTGTPAQLVIPGTKP